MHPFACVLFTCIQVNSTHEFSGFLRFTSGATPADLLAAKLFLIHILTYIQALMGLESGIECAAAGQRVVRQMLYRMSYAGSALPMITLGYF